jgi:cysteinyl-tRNA synthetase
VQNVTDVGHLASDADEGEDKMEKGAKKYGKTVWEVANFYTKYFYDTMDFLNVLRPTVIAKATEHISDMIQLIQELEKKGYTYETDEAVYFDVTKFPHYGELSGQKLEDKVKGAREEVYVDPAKKNPADFTLWFKRVKRFKDHIMHWDSPWGDGFPGWHIECSAMSMKYLGVPIDIHTGGVDHVPVHHENEIAQSEAATGKKFVDYWVHHEHLLVDGKKMSKSVGNFYTIDDVRKKNIDPISLKLLFLQSHYRQQMNFTWESAKAAHDAYTRLKETIRALQKQTQRTTLSEDKLKQLDQYRQRFADALTNDLQTPQAVAIMWEMLKSNIPSPDKLDLLYEFDQVFGLKLNEITEEQIPEEIITLATERQKYKQEKNFAKADELRKEIGERGYIVEDTADGFIVKIRIRTD